MTKKKLFIFNKIYSNANSILIKGIINIDEINKLILI